MFPPFLREDIVFARENLKPEQLQRGGGFTAAIWAAAKGDSESLKLLIEAGCNLKLTDLYL